MIHKELRLARTSLFNLEFYLKCFTVPIPSKLSVTPKKIKIFVDTKTRVLYIVIS